MTAPRTCTDCSTRLNKANRSENPALCVSCFEAAMAANDDTTKVVWPRISHKGHGHPATFAAREACRKALRDASLIEGQYGDHEDEE